MVINLRGLDKYESNHTGDGQTGTSLQVFSGLGGFQDSLTWNNFLERQKCVGIQGIIWLI